MKVSVKTLKGNHFDIEVQPTDTVLNVKKQIEQIQGAQNHPSEQQRLIYKRKELMDKTTIKQNKVSENAILVVKLSKMLTYRGMTYHVQNPHTEEFSAADIVWIKGVGKKGIVHDVAVIPYYRLDNFVKGEGSSARTKFCLTACKTKEDSSDKKRVDAILKTATYCCSYGIEDHRKGGTIRPSRKCTELSKKKCRGRALIKQGCLSNFCMARYVACPFVAFIKYKKREHVDKSGSACCHKPLDDKAIGTQFMTKPSNHGGTDPPLTLGPSNHKLTLGPSNHKGINLPPVWNVKKIRSKLGTQGKVSTAEGDNKANGHKIASDSPTMRAT